MIQFTFEPPPLVTIRASQVEVCWNSISNLTYQVQYRSDLTTNLWTSLWKEDCLIGTRISAVLEYIRRKLPGLSSLIPTSSDLSFGITKDQQNTHSFLPALTVTSVDRAERGASGTVHFCIGGISCDRGQRRDRSLCLGNHMFHGGEVIPVAKQVRDQNS